MKLKYALTAVVLAISACGGEDIDPTDEEQTNRAPTANFNFEVLGQTVNFSNQSTDPDGDTLSYDWQFGESNSSTSASPTHSFVPGSYQVMLVVSDGELSDSVVKTVVIEDSGQNETFVGDAGRGRLLYGDDILQCADCHGAQGEGPVATIDASKFSAASSTLETLIHQTMPSTDPEMCEGQCAADIAAYIVSWTVTTPTQACEENITYGPRQLKLLTREEYQNTLEDLVGIDFNAAATIPADAEIHGYNNNIMAAVTQVHQESYFEAAKAVAAWSKERNFDGVVNCSFSDQQSCVDDFLNGFAKRAFRRPLTNGEISAFTALFGENFTGGDTQAGVEMALTAALVSPAFLYRSEQGVPVSIGEHDGGQYEFSGDVTSMVANDFTDKRHYNAGTEPGSVIFGDTTNNQQGKLGKHLNFTGAGTLLEFSIRAVLGEDGTIPTVKYSVGGTSGSIVVDWEEFRTISLYLPEISGHMEFAFYLDSSPARIEVHEFKFGEAQRLEGAPDQDAYELTPYEIATYLAYTFTGSTPDSALMAAADANELQTDEQIAAQVNRLLNTPKAEKRLGNFAAQWLGTDLALTQPKDMMLFPELTDDIRKSMVQEVRELFAHSTLKGNSFSEFFNTDYAFVDSTLAQYYGLNGVSGSVFQAVSGAGERGGVVTTGAFHVAYGNFEETSPIVRAARVREKLLCQEIPPPPPGIAVDRAAAEERIADIINSGGSVTQRTRTALLTEEPYCAQCHEEIINPLGFGMEDFDTIGRFQMVDVHDNAVDASGVLHGMESLNDVGTTSVPFTGGKGLGEVLANTESVYECFVENAFRFATGMGIEKIDKNNPELGVLSDQEKSDYACSVKGMTETMIHSGYDAREVFKSLGTMKLIRYRKEMNR